MVTRSFPNMKVWSEALRALGNLRAKRVLSARGVQAGGKALRIRRMNGVEVRRKRPRGSK